MRTISHELRTYPHLMGQAHLYDSIVREIWQAVPTVQRNPHIIHDWDTNPNFALMVSSSSSSLFHLLKKNSLCHLLLQIDVKRFWLLPTKGHLKVPSAEKEKDKEFFSEEFSSSACSYLQ
ncbi:hypothetical protein CEXT_65091 [Caerostris extrusa]|uniref:Uncharacterized protein n=1 Tax=Caerostris extrusa TaxID=172846 RepID=A0AAV4WFT3_CAEEX|nr:hypothetical protein CEXT_65091 [Caerostris extrusa]